MDDLRLDAAIREGLADRFASPVTRLEVERAIVRPYSQVRFCTVGFESRPALRIVAKIVTGPADNMQRQQVLMARDFRINEHLHATMPAAGRHAVPRPLVFRPELNLIVTEFMSGTRLQDLLRSSCRGWPSATTMATLEAACEGCGSWIREFQQASAGLVESDSEFGRGLDSIDPSTCVEQVDVCLDWMRMAGASPFGATEEGELLDFVRARAGAIGGDDARVVGVHGDYFAGNVLHDGSRTVGFDFVMFRKGMRLVDPSYFLLHLETLKLIPGMRRHTVHRLGRAFVRGYDSALSLDGFWTSCPAAEVLYVLHGVRRLWGMTDGKPAPHRAVLRRLQAVWTARQLLRHARRLSPAQAA